MLNPKVQYVVDHYTNSKRYYSSLRNKFKDWDWLYYGIRDNPKYNWQSNVADRTTYKSIMTILSRILNTTFSIDPPFDVLGREQSDEQFAPIIKNLIKYQFEEQGLYHKYMMFVLQCLIRGTSVGKIYWKKENQTRTIRKPLIKPIEEPVINPAGGLLLNEIGVPVMRTVGEEIIGYAKEKKTEVKFDDPYFEVIDVRNFFPEPDAVDVNDGFMIHRTFKTLDELKKQSKKTSNNGEVTGIYDNVNEIKIEDLNEDGNWSYDHARLNDLGMSSPKGYRTEHTQDKKAKLNKLVEILEGQGKYDINNDGVLEDCLITVANRKTLLRAIENPFYHNQSIFVKITYEPILNEFFGRGVAEIAEDIQEELNDKRNQRLDNVNLTLQPIMKYVEGMIHPAIVKNFRHAPGAKMPVRDINAVGWDRPPDVTLGAHKEIEDLKNDILEITGATPPIAATANINDVHRTAAGMMMLQNRAGERLKPKIEMMENDGLKKIVERFHQLNQQFITKEKVIRIVGEKGATYPRVSPEDLQHSFDFIAAGTKEIANKEMNIMQVLRFLEVGSKIPNFNIALNYDEIGRKLLGLFGFQNENFVKSKQEIQAELQRQQQMAMMQMQQKGAESATKQQPAIPAMTGEGAGMDEVRRMLSSQRGGY